MSNNEKGENAPNRGKSMRTVTLIFAALLVAVALVTHFRFPLAVAAISTGEAPPLTPQGELAENEEWFDDYYTVATLGDGLFAIGEPRVSGPVFSYLIIGETRALLFDTGMPLRNMLPVVQSLTDKPVTALASHLHFDHVGNNQRFENVAMLDTEQTRAQIEDGWFTPTSNQFLGHPEGHEILRWQVSELLPEGTVIDLGARKLTLIRTPGHTDQSVSLWDPVRAQLFTGDYIYEGALYAFLPNSSLQDYMDTAIKLVDLIAKDTKLYTAHRWEMVGTPILEYQDLADLHATLTKIQNDELSGTGAFPLSYPVNSRITLDADLPWYQGWD
jgi:hydroxyacylglutathione hydrolase